MMYTRKNAITEEEHQSLIKLVSELQFSPSPVYDRSSGKNIVKTATRKSKTAHVKLCHSRLVSRLCDKLISSVRQHRDIRRADLARDYVTIIQYDEGDFFDWHSDFRRSLTYSDAWVEAHLLLCLEAPEEGGELEIEGQSNYAYTERGAILFDKSQRHRALPVNKGRKIIISVDVELTRKIDPVLDPVTQKYYEKREPVWTTDVDVIEKLRAVPGYRALQILVKIDVEGDQVMFDSNGLYLCPELPPCRGGTAAEVKGSMAGGKLDITAALRALIGPDVHVEPQSRKHATLPWHPRWSLELSGFSPLTEPPRAGAPAIDSPRSKVEVYETEEEWCNEEYYTEYNYYDTKIWIYVPFHQLHRV